MLSDEIVLNNLDEALRTILTPICKTMDRLFDIGFTPVGDIPTITLAIAIFIWRYNECRDLGVSIEDSLKIAQGSVLQNPNISRHLAQKGFIVINNIAGVEE